MDDEEVLNQREKILRSSRSDINFVCDGNYHEQNGVWSVIIFNFTNM